MSKDLIKALMIITIFMSKGAQHIADTGTTEITLISKSWSYDCDFIYNEIVKGS